ncbi:MAG: iron chelate uptake ABC transporter family permease subunit, partial [Aequorivita vladivostokensis]|nr:iron chelate uptake ABC transporter family permease subunit [Aequorivita vladivostokensis]
MQVSQTYRLQFAVLFVALLAAFLMNLGMGSVSIPLNEIISVFIGNGASKETWRYIIFDYRLPKALTAMLAGGGLAVSGLLMQTLFRNPLAGPFVLGLSSGASLGVAILILGASACGGFFGTLLLSQWSLV